MFNEQEIKEKEDAQEQEVKAVDDVTEADETQLIEDEDSIDQDLNLDDYNASDEDSKIYCANCVNCILVKVPIKKEGEYVLRIKCSLKQWKKKLGDEKIYKFFTVARRTVDQCSMYESMGDLKEYLKDLRKTLPVKDEIYTS